MKERPYAILDVFTKNPFSGNPLAVVFDAEGLSTGMMQTIAGEFNLAETVFVFPASDTSNTAALRIFTPKAELPFAGHPTVGASVLLAKRKLGEVKEPTDISLILEERVGPVQVGVVVEPGRTGHATFVLPQKPEHVAPAVSRLHIAEALSIHEDDIGFDQYRPCIYSAGVPFTLVPVKGLKAIESIKPNAQAWSKAFETAERDNAFIYTRGGERDNANFHARMFWPGAGIIEDPATGAAIAAFAGAIAQFEKLPDGAHLFQIEQGFEMGRPSEITLEIDIEDGEIFAARIGGSAVIVAEGVLYV